MEGPWQDWIISRREENGRGIGNEEIEAAEEERRNKNKPKKVFVMGCDMLSSHDLDAFFSAPPRAEDSQIRPFIAGYMLMSL